jgi:hypothetical protein
MQILPDISFEHVIKLSNINFIDTHVFPSDKLTGNSEAVYAIILPASRAKTIRSLKRGKIILGALRQ